MAKSRKKQCRTQADLAKRLGVSTKTIAQWRDNFTDWPDRKSDGSFDVRRVEAFCRRHGVGPHNPSRGRAAQQQRGQLRAALTSKLIESAENRRIANERLRAIQQKELSDIVFTADVNIFLKKMREVVLRGIDELTADVERQLDEPPEHWPATRAKIMKLTIGLQGRIAAAVRQLAEQ